MNKNSTHARNKTNSVVYSVPEQRTCSDSLSRKERKKNFGIWEMILGNLDDLGNSTTFSCAEE